MRLEPEASARRVLWRRRWARATRTACLLLVAATAACLLPLHDADRFYWGTPLFAPCRSTATTAALLAVLGVALALQLTALRRGWRPRLAAAVALACCPLVLGVDLAHDLAAHLLVEVRLRGAGVVLIAAAAGVSVLGLAALIAQVRARAR